ncbi:unnamed protein product [Citrullus colocynthis]|uniref:Uncharacterized protein n=1 Tax=Citrullus colocynthis TaxID=252529 RepID=A0ABP0Z7A2_9ROSI
MRVTHIVLRLKPFTSRVSSRLHQYRRILKFPAPSTTAPYPSGKNELHYWMHDGQMLSLLIGRLCNK